MSKNFSMEKLNAKLEDRMYLLGGGEPTISDFVTLWQCRETYEKLDAKDQREKFCAVTRWFDSVQRHPRVRSFKGEEHSGAKPWKPVTVGHHSVEDVLNEKASAAMLKAAASNAPVVAKKKSNDKAASNNAKQKQQKKQKKEKKKKKAQPAAATQSYFDKGDIRVGYVTKAWKHPEADKLFCEEIDVGEFKVRSVIKSLSSCCDENITSDTYFSQITYS